MNRSLVALFVLPAIALAAPVPKPAGERMLLVTTADQKLTLVSPDGSNSKTVLEWKEGEEVTTARLSPDGKQLLYYRSTDGGRGGETLRVLTLATGEDEELFKPRGLAATFWSADSRTVYGTDEDEELLRDSSTPGSACRRSWAIDVKSGKRRAVELDGSYQLVGLVPGDNAGDVFCTRVTEAREFKKPLRGVQRVMKYETAVTTASRVDLTVVIPEFENVWPVGPLAGGKRWLVCDNAKAKLGIYTQGEKAVEWWDRAVGTTAAGISPNGQQVAYAAKAGKDNDGLVCTADADGSREKVIWRSKQRIMSVSWR